jgi:hypothetical protein
LYSKPIHCCARGRTVHRSGGYKFCRDVLLSEKGYRLQVSWTVHAWGGPWRLQIGKVGLMITHVCDPDMTLQGWVCMVACSCQDDCLWNLTISSRVSLQVVYFAHALATVLPFIIVLLALNWPGLLGKSRTACTGCMHGTGFEQNKSEHRMS